MTPTGPGPVASRRPDHRSHGGSGSPRRWRRWWRRLRRRFGGEVLLGYEFDLADAAGTEVADRFRLVEADADTLTAMKRAHPTRLSDRKLEILRGRVGGTDEVCWLIVRDDGALCGYCHLAFVDHVNARVNAREPVGPGDAYFFDDHVFPRHRGRGIHGVSIVLRARAARERGRSRGLTTISRSNRVSRASYARFGVRRRRVLVHLRSVHRTVAVPLPGRRTGP